jgi:hypothetical protein
MEAHANQVPITAEPPALPAGLATSPSSAAGDDLEAVRNVFITSTREDGVETGHIRCSSAERFARLLHHTAPSFYEMASWRDADHRRVFLSEETRSLLTFCEGDVMLQHYQTDREFARERMRQSAFYLR